MQHDTYSIKLLIIFTVAQKYTNNVSSANFGITQSLDTTQTCLLKTQNWQARQALSSVRMIQF